MTPATAMFDLGEEFDEGARSKLTDTSQMSEEDRVRFEWPALCKDLDVVLKGDGKPRTPPLLSWKKSGDTEVFEVGLPGKFSNPAVQQNFPEWLSAARGAESFVVLKPKKTVMRIVLSHFPLPEMLMFDVDSIPADPDVFDLGLLSEGSRLRWNTRSIMHGLIAGQTSSGKSETGAMVLTQAHWKKDWAMRVLTPKINDPTFKAFADFPQHRVVTGVDEASFGLAVDMLEVEVAEMKARQAIRGEFGVDWWHEVPEEVRLDRLRVMVAIDESPDYVQVDHQVDEKWLIEAKSNVKHLVTQLARKSRSERQHILIMTQTPYVDGVGGGVVWNQLGFRLGVRSVSPDFTPRMFHKSKSSSVSDVLESPGTKPGRGVARGAEAPPGELGSIAVDDAPVQIAYLPRDEREVLLGLRDAPAVRGPVIDTVEVDRPPLLGEGEESVPPPPQPVPALPAGETVGGSGVYYSSQFAAASLMFLLAVVLVMVVA